MEASDQRLEDRGVARYTRLAAALLLEVFFALLPTDLSAFLGALIRSRGALALAAAQVVAASFILIRTLPSALILNLPKG